jgi:hypothetical protein
MNPRGRDALFEYGVSMVQSDRGALTLDSQKSLIRILRDFVFEVASKSECSQKLKELIGSNGYIEDLECLMKMDDTPLPAQSDGTVGPEQDRRTVRSWSNEEDRRLVGGIYRFGPENWKRVAEFVGNGRTRAQCAQRWIRGLNPKISKRRWTPEEDHRLLQLYADQQDGSWAKIAYILGDRTDVQVRYRYRKLMRMAQLMENQRSQPQAIPAVTAMPPLTTYAIVPANMGVFMAPVVATSVVALPVNTVPTHPPQQTQIESFISFFQPPWLR